MATNPAFAATPNVGAQVLPGFDASFTAPATAKAVVIATGGASGTKIDEVVVKGLATLAAGVVNIWLYDGTTFYLYDQVELTTNTASTTTAAARWVRQYTNLVVKNGWTLRASHTTTGNDTSKIAVIATGGDF